jgi:hypothetical protein
MDSVVCACVTECEMRGEHGVVRGQRPRVQRVHVAHARHATERAHSLTIPVKSHNNIFYYFIS